MMDWFWPSAEPWAAMEPFLRQNQPEPARNANR